MLSTELSRFGYTFMVFFATVLHRVKAIKTVVVFLVLFFFGLCNESLAPYLNFPFTVPTLW